MADDQFDPAEFAASRPVAPAPSTPDDQFDPDEFAAHKASMSGTVPVEQPGIKDAIGKVAQVPIDYAKNVYEAGKNALSAFSEGVDPNSKTNKAAMETAKTSPVAGALENLKSSARGVGAIGEFAAAPITGAIKTAAPAIAGPMALAEKAIGEPIAKAINPNAKLPSDEEVYNANEPSVETALGLAVPGRGRLAAMPRTAPPAPPKPETPFGVNLDVGQETGDADAQGKISAALNNRSGKAAYDLSTARRSEQAQQVEASKDVATAQLSPTGDIVARTPEEAGNIISEELRTREGQRQQAASGELARLQPSGLDHPLDSANTVAGALRQSADALATSRESNATALAADTESLRNQFGNGQVLASNPQEAADIVSAGVTRAEEQATQARDDAYDRFNNLPGSFRPKAFTDVANKVRRAVLYDPNDPFIANDKTTPNTLNAINDLDEHLGAPARVAADPDTQSFEPFTPSRINDIRKRLNAYYRSANNAARATNDYSDVHGMGRVIDAFDDVVTDALKRKRLFDGNGQQISQAWDDALAAHRYLRQTFSPQGKGDVVGPIMNKIVGQREGQAATVNEIERWTTGSGGDAVKVGRRLRELFNDPASPEIGAIKQSMWSKAVDPPADGMPELTPVQKANNIDKLRSSALAREYFSTPELGQMRQHAVDLRNSVVPRTPSSDVVGSTIEKMNGVGGQPWTPEQTASTLFGRRGIGEDPTGVKLAQHVKATYGEDSAPFRALQQGQISSLTRVAEGKAGFDPAGIAADIRAHLNGDGRSMADTLWDAPAKKTLNDYADRLDDYAKRTAMPGKNDPVQRAIARITGRDGAPPATDQEVARMIMSRDSAADKGTSIGLVRHLKQVLPPEKFAAVKQAIFRQLIEPGPAENGAISTSARIVSKMAKMFNNAPELMREVFTPDDVKMIKSYQAMHRQMIPSAAANQNWNKPWYDGLRSKINQGIISAMGMVIGHALSPVPVLGEFIGARAGSMLNGVNDMRIAGKSAREVAQLMPTVTEKMDQWQKAFMAAQRAGLPSYRTRSVAAAGALSNALKPLGLDFRGIVGAAAQQNGNSQSGPQNKQRDQGVQPQARSHGGQVADSLKHPKVPGARLAPDGQYYVKDPNRPGKFLKVVDRARSAAA